MKMQLARQNKSLLAAGILTVLYSGLHVFGGGPEVHVPILESSISPFLKGISSVIWHAITAIMLFNGLALIWLAGQTEQRAMGWLVVAQFTAFAGIFVAYGLIRFGDLFVMPQWIGFLTISAIAAWGLRGHTRKAAAA